MHLTRGVHHRVQEGPSASDLLGVDHPLARVLVRLSVTWTQSLAVAALLLMGAFASVEGVSGSLWVVVAAAAVEVLLLFRAVLLIDATHEHARDLIAQGRGDLPLSVVDRVRRRLVDPRRRRQLASALDEMRQQAARAPDVVHPVCNGRVIAAVAPELATIAALLRRDEAGERGVAIADRLVVDDGSPLYRDDVESLRIELRRTRYLLHT